MKIAIIGAGRQARISLEILSYDRNMEVVAFVDNAPHQTGDNIKGIPVLGDHSVIPGLIKEGLKGVVVAVGNNEIRSAHFEKLRGMGLVMVNAVHPTASIAPSVSLGSDVSISTRVVINDSARIGNSVIIGTGVIIDHESVVEDYVEIGQACSIAGRVNIKKGVTIGIGSIIGPYVTVGQNTVIGAGSVVLEDIPDNVTLGRQRRLIKR